MIQVAAHYRPSLLADVAEVVSGRLLLVCGAHVMTLGRRAVDVLHLTDQRGRPLDASMTERVIAALMDAAAT